MAETKPSLTLTPKAAEFAIKLLEKAGIQCPPGGIRFKVKAGGCHGYELLHQLERNEDSHDIIIISNDARILVDPKSIIPLRGLEIDHTDNLLDKPFFVTGAKTCGCGTSFSPS